MILNVLIASPSDVSAERDAVESAIHEWNPATFGGDRIRRIVESAIPSWPFPESPGVPGRKEVISVA